MSAALRSVALVVGAVAVFAATIWLRTPSTAVSAPDFLLPDLSGEVVRLHELRGKVVVLNLWATWCPPCVEEMPTLEKLSRTFAGRDLVVLAASQDERQEAVRPWVEEQDLTLPVLLDPRGELGSIFGVTGYPETFVIDRQGKIVFHDAGYRDWAEPAMIAALEGLLATGEWRAP